MSTHRLSEHHFAALASGYGDVHTVTELLAIERSWRLVQLRAILDAAKARADAAGPLEPVEMAWELIAESERRAPDATHDLLLHPQVGTWAGYTLRRMRRSTPVDDPLWIDVGYLHSIAAAAAIRARLDFKIRVPARAGFAALPTLGGAGELAQEAWDLAEVTATAGDATISSRDSTVTRSRSGEGSSGWMSLPVIRVEAAGHMLSVSLDCIDPYRNLRTPVPPRPMSADNEDEWRTLLAGAWELLVRECPRLALPIARGLYSVVPQPAAERFRTMSASAGDAFGSMLVSAPPDATELAVTLVHEFQHIKLGSLLHLTPLHEGEPAQRLYAPWRDDPRPMSGLLQGVYAFVGIVEFWRSVRVVDGPNRALAQFEFGRWRDQVSATLDLLAALPQLTDVGQRLVAGMRETASGWFDDDVPPAIGTAAVAANVDHRALWRIHHLRPDPTLVTTLAAAFVAGTPAPYPVNALPAPDVVTDPDARLFDTRGVLTQLRIADGTDGTDTVPAGATAADHAYVAGDLDRARDLYLGELGAEPARLSAWVGLGLVSGSRSLQERPELVRAVCAAVHAATSRPAEPLAVAAWLDRAA